MSNIFDYQLFTSPVQPTPEGSFNYIPGTDIVIGKDANKATTGVSSSGFGKLLLPGLRKIFFETYGELPEQFSRVYNVNTSSKAVERDFGMGAFGDWTKRADQFDTVAYKTLSPGLERTYMHDAFTQGFMVTREMFDDEDYRQMEKLPKAMARSGRAKVEKDATSLFVNAFKGDKTDGTEDTNKIFDGLALCSATGHALLDKAGAKYINMITGKLTDTNLKIAIKKMRETPDEAGNLIQMKGTKLIIPPALLDTALRLLHSTQVVGSNFNDTNKFLTDSGIEIVVLDYLGATAGGNDEYWFLVDGGRHELNFFWRVRPEFKWDEDFDTFVSKYRGYMRYSYGVSDWRGIIGSNGTTA